MRIRVYNEKGGTQALLFEPSTGRGLSPVLIKGVKREDVHSTVASTVQELRRPVSPALPATG